MLVVSLVYAKSKEEERVANCATVMEEIMNVPDNIPQELVDKAECIGVIPSVKKVAIGFGGSYGAGAFLCRSGEKFTGSWSAPAMYRLEGGSFGLQLGGSATDFVLLVMNPKGAEAIIKSKAKLGGDASAAAGPKGRTAAAATDVTMQAEVLTYSRAKGAFAGVSLEGSTLRPDDGANKDLYGRQVEAREILREGKLAAPEAGKPLVAFLNKRSPKNLSK
jgi:lipid-binding SYLF domain-containing protein